MSASTTASIGAGRAAVATDALLLKGSYEGDDEFLRELLKSLPDALSDTPVRVKAVLSKTRQDFYVYLHFDAQARFAQVAAKKLESAWQVKWPQLKNLQVSRLEKVFAAQGLSADSEPVFHYVVEMDPEAGWMPALSDWYDTEHMPGLATVPGCVRATRYLNHDHGPLSLACYDLVTEETLGSAVWLAVRGTEWSSRMRPRFTNTIRSMFRYA